MFLKSTAMYLPVHFLHDFGESLGFGYDECFDLDYAWANGLFTLFGPSVDESIDTVTSYVRFCYDIGCPVEKNC